MPDNERLTLTAKEVSRQLGLSISSVYHGLRNGDIPSVSVGRRRLIPKIAVQKWLAEAGNRTEDIPGKEF